MHISLKHALGWVLAGREREGGGKEICTQRRRVSRSCPDQP